jgi:hypothetical protein
MSKRKSNIGNLSAKNEDFVFEDDDETEDQIGESAAESESTSRGFSRVSGRAKKAKSIYDPSEHNGPVHKRKKEALEAEKAKLATKTITQVLPVEQPRSPHHSPSKTASPAKAATPKAKDETKRVDRNKSQHEPTSRLTFESKKVAAKPIAVTLTKVSISTVPVPLVKEPSKRIQARKKAKVPESGDSSSAGTSKRRLLSVSTNTDYDNASTVELHTANNSGIPDVRQWSHKQVSAYFLSTLGFSKNDAAIFTEEEIDGETLMISKFDYIVKNIQIFLIFLSI